ncbi:MAG: sensor histidine kinase, partial [Chthoniobacteraceae bacterium]
EPEPVRVTMKQALTGANDANLVTLDAQLIELLETPTESVLLLRAENVAFSARLTRTTLPLRAGSRVQLTGICRVEEPSFPRAGFQAKPRSIELLLRSPSDIVVLAAPSWWTAQRLAWAGAVLLGIATAALGWAATLRRRVAAQTAVIREKVEREAVLEERQRVAREMHDTLAQSFSGLGFQLEALAARLPSGANEAQAQLETAKQMVRHGQEEFRRSLLNLRASELERGGLAIALPELARQITAGTGIALHFETAGTPRSLPEATEANLLRIAQECVNNAVRHARAKRIGITLEYAESSVRLTITDDGCGFDPARAALMPSGHFGLRGIRERAEQIRAKVDLHSQPGDGTTLTVIAPC